MLGRGLEALRARRGMRSDSIGDSWKTRTGEADNATGGIGASNCLSLSVLYRLSREYQCTQPILLSKRRTAAPVQNYTICHSFEAREYT